MVLAEVTLVITINFQDSIKIIEKQQPILYKYFSSLTSIKRSNMNFFVNKYNKQDIKKLYIYITKPTILTNQNLIKLYNNYINI